jgi:hypothetical protein
VKADKQKTKPLKNKQPAFDYLLLHVSGMSVGKASACGAI